ncbi:Zinc finger, FYVE/PHD-type [Moelleriella libera RCEF 2490]|uniref:Zinc finger, FYVE/PHD-type n=1 Tax=Moelleriella libera RCEF 2490 TaxID=1081109 RepID=A0A166UXK4_9HYPO|nr:Zinc finger, FYVE/PHD-type [Moelleriella libera RCEF 2490]
MAADLIMPVIGRDQQQSRHFLADTPSISSHHARSRSCQVPQGLQISPIDTSLQYHTYHSTPPSPSPALHTQSAGRPMYMPAVLRRCDEFPSHKVTRCRTAGSTSSTESDSLLTLRRSNTGIMSIPGLALLGKRMSRRSLTDEPAKTLDGDWQLDAFPQITGTPTREHWKRPLVQPDPESSICDDPTCKRTFNYFIRRHHCRKCGNIFCDWHSSAALPLDQDANFNPRAPPSRTCNHCFGEAKALHSRNSSPGSSSTTSVSDDAPPSTPIMAAPPAPGVTPPHKPEVAASVPCDWNWSTF